ncbi:hypothetical protein PCANC_01611 [Puccinia coronata f. sp. avenae]|uniref:Proteasome activator Blm10 mid region domain-containing protein n=2 Tax=Puccinia coronata f. sp. avenae TaxID=200324 RepID=A0A2N5USC2_9BASI|nr:hypothetical protein PCASD_08315 [Puccinia coronata f. sp. avenae]PLW55774.1 hypothetical protein PCANC_01611 [Puccinia coronata f. sp. avenae]
MELDPSSSEIAEPPRQNHTPTLPPHLQSPSGSSRNDKTHPNLMPYPIESLEEMDAHLELIIRHLLEAAQAKDFECAFNYWQQVLEKWLDFRYPIKRRLRARLASLYYNLIVSPGMDPDCVQRMAKLLIPLIKSDKYLDVRDLQLQWKPLYDVLEPELFPKQRATGLTTNYYTYFNLAEVANTYFPPHTTIEILETILPQLQGIDINTILSTQSLLCHFLPISHPLPWLDSIFRLWNTFQSQSWDSQWLDLLARLSHKHLDPNASDPRLEHILKNMKPGDNFDTHAREALSTFEGPENWSGIHRDVGIYTERQWSFIMTQCVRYFSVPVGSSTIQAAATYSAKVTDTKLASRVHKMLKPSDTLKSFAIIIVTSMTEDPDSGDCRALTSLSKLLTAMETFFHPSNHGRWSAKLAKFLNLLAKQFARRWSSESRTEQNTPARWKLTARIKMRFVSMLSNVLLMSMFSKDSTTATWTQHALKIAALLEPSVMVPPIVERSVLALEGLLETHRTTACIAALTSIMGSMLNVQSFRHVAGSLPTILDLLLPGIDPNDPSKTMHTAMLVLQTVSKIKISNITVTSDVQVMLDPEQDHPDIADSSQFNPSQPDSGLIVLESETFFADWALTYFQRVMGFFENLPEPQGKQEKTGGKLEESTINFLCASFDELCKAVSPELGSKMVDYFKSYISDNVRSNMVKAVELVSGSLSRGIQGGITFQSIYPLCDARIRAELEAGVASAPTMSTNSPSGPDLRLHWFMSIIVGICNNAGLAILEYKESVLSLLNLVLKDCKTERSYLHASTLLYIILRSLIEYYPEDSRFLNPEEWDSSNDQTLWGKTYKAQDTKIRWHVPSPEEINLAVVILEEVVQPYMTELDAVLHKPGLDHDEKCNFVKLCTMAKFVVAGISAFVVMGSPDDPGDSCTHWGEHLPGARDDLPIMRTGIPLVSPDDRWATVMKFKKSVSELAHQAATKVAIFEDNIKCVQSIVSLMSSILLDYACETPVHDYHKDNYNFVLELTRISKSQQEYPRVYWIRRAQWAHFTRLRSLKLVLQRSSVDDKLIKDLTEFSVSSWLSIRRSAQKVLDSVCHIYDGSRNLVTPTLFESLKPGSDSDQMKGAMYVLASKTFLKFCMADAQLCSTFYLSMLQCQHAEKSSVQSLVSNLLSSSIIRQQELSTLKNTILVDGTNELISSLNSELTRYSIDPEISQVLESRRRARVENKNKLTHKLVDDLLVIAQAASTHWKYSLHANRLLSSMVRRDEPINAAVATHVVNELMNSELPSKRTYAISTITKMLHFVKLRTFIESDEDLLTKKSRNPLAMTLDFPSTQDHEQYEKFFTVLQRPLNEHPEYLVDKLRNGWLICGSEKVYKPPGDKVGTVWESSSGPALDALKEIMLQETFWQKMTAHLSQEHTRNYPLDENVILLKTIFQIFGNELWPSLLPKLEELLADPEDRHKQRAAAEIISGVIRATKHWPLKQQEDVWSWFGNSLQKIYDSITPAMLSSWVMCVESILWGRDPRRNQPLVDFILNLEMDSGTSAFLTTKAHHFIGSLLRSMPWPFMRPLLPKYTDLYWKSINHDYREVRACVSLNLRALNETETHPCFRNLSAFLEACRAGTDEPLLVTDTLLNGMLPDLFKDMEKLRKIRLPAQHGDQEYDKCAMTVLAWLWSCLSDAQAAAAYPFIPGLIPELFYMHEMIDNQELSKLAYAILMPLATLAWPRMLVDRFLATLLDLSQAKSWKVRLDVLTVLRVFFFHQVYNLSRPQVEEVMESLCKLLEDSNMEVREAAATTLSGIVHCSERESILHLKERFTATLRANPTPKQRFLENGVERPGYQATLIKIHSAVLGSSALVNAFPYDVPPWVPQILIHNLCSHLSSPPMISTTARKTLTVYKKTHQDTWIEGQKMFSEEELTILNDCLVGSSYYA